MQIYSKRRTRKPNAGARLNRGHRILQQYPLRYCFPFNEGGGGYSVGIANQALPLTATTIPTDGLIGSAANVTWNPKGCLSYASSTTSYVDCGQNDDTTGEITFFAWVNLDSFPLLSTLFGQNDASGNESIDSLYFEQVGGTGNRLTWWVFTGVSATKVVSGTTALTTELDYRIAGRRSGAAGAWTYTTWINEEQDGTASAAANPAVKASDGNLRIGFAGAYTGAPFIGDYYYFLMLQGALKDDDVLSISRNPWQLWEPPKRYWIANKTGIAFDAASNSGPQTLTNTYNWNHTCTGSNRFLAVDVSLLSAGATVVSITYNGVALSAIPNANKATVTSLGSVECWGLANPASGTNSIVVTVSGSITSCGTAVSYTNVHQTSPTEAGNGNQATNVGAADATVDITSVADQCWIHAALVVNDDAVTAGQTNRNNVSFGGVGSGLDEDFGPQAAGLKTMSVTAIAGLKTWAIAGYALRPVTASVITTYFGEDLMHNPGFSPILAM